MQNCADDVPFIGPQTSRWLWIWLGRAKNAASWWKPGDVVKVKDIEIHALDAFDRTALSPCPRSESRWRTAADGMDVRAVNYLFKTPGGNLYQRRFSLFNYYAKHGSDIKLMSRSVLYGENPRVRGPK